MPLEVIVRPIATSDAASYRICLDSVAHERRYLAQMEALPLERIEAFVRESVAQGAAQFVAVDGSTVVGWADVFSNWASAVSHCGILGMGVLAEYRGRGIGTTLLSACLGKAAAKGISRVVLEVRADNSNAIHLYEKAGFAVEARMRNAMRFDGVYYEALQMSLINENAA